MHLRQRLRCSWDPGEREGWGWGQWNVTSASSLPPTHRTLTHTRAYAHNATCRSQHGQSSIRQLRFLIGQIVPQDHVEHYLDLVIACVEKDNLVRLTAACVLLTHRHAHTHTQTHSHQRQTDRQTQSPKTHTHTHTDTHASALCSRRSIHSHAPLPSRSRLLWAVGVTGDHLQPREGWNQAV